MKNAIHRLAAVILAAGSGRRFGGIKQLAEFNGCSLLERIVTQCEDLASVQTVVVLGAAHERIALEANLSQVKTLYNSQWQQGLASSIRTAVNDIGDSYDGLLFVAADQAALTTASLTQLVDAWHRHPSRIVCASYAGSEGIPVIFPRAFFDELKLLEGDSGAKKLLEHQRDQLVRVNLPEASVDIDTHADLAALSKTASIHVPD